MKSRLDRLKVEIFSFHKGRKFSLHIKRNRIFLVGISQIKLLMVSLLFLCNASFFLNVNSIRSRT